MVDIDGCMSYSREEQSSRAIFSNELIKLIACVHKTTAWKAKGLLSLSRYPLLSSPNSIIKSIGLFGIS